MARLQHITGSVTLTLSVSQYDEKYFADGAAPSLGIMKPTSYVSKYFISDQSMLSL